MEHLSNFWLFVISSLGGMAGTTVVVWLFNKPIQHLLNSDLERIKTDYLKQLDDYRLALLGEVETTKGKVELKKASALWLLEKRFKSTSRLLEHVEGSVDNCYSIASQPTSQRSKISTEIIATRVIEIEQSLKQAKPFLNADAINDCKLLIDELAQIHKHVVQVAQPLAECDIDRLTYTRATTIEQRLEANLLTKLREMDL